MRIREPNAFHGDPSAAMLRDGQLVAARPKAHLRDKLVRTFGPDLSSPVRISAGGYIKRNWARHMLTL